MARLKTRLNTPPPESNHDRLLASELLSAWTELANLLNGGLTLSDNLRGEILTVSDSGAADSSNTVAHTLKRIPTGFIVVNTNKGGVVYDAGTSWTVTSIYLKCTTANTTYKVFVF